MYKKIYLLPLVAVLAACGVTSSDGVMSRGENKSGFLNMSKSDDVKVDGIAALEGLQNVVIGSFKVGFVESAKQTNKAKGTFMKGGFGGKAKGNVTIEGISEKTKKNITDAAYADFMKKLKDQGYNVLSRSALTSSAEYASMSTKTFPYVADNSGFLSAYGKTVFYQPSALGSTGVAFAGDFPQSSSGSSAAAFIPGITGISGAMAVNSDMKVANYAEENQVGVISATYVLDFAAAGGHAGISSASVVIGQNLAVTQASVKVVTSGSSTFKNGLANIYLGQPIESGKEFGEVINDTSGADIAVQEAANVASLLLGQGTNRSRNYIIKAEPAKYKAQSLDVLTRTNTALLSMAK
ncbi:MAG: hypothetical protein GW778_09285 [Alphaproteobacteria bacterium]|nr:hypothetical protein [Alphaproteobacteria bacterium]